MVLDGFWVFFGWFGVVSGLFWGCFGVFRCCSLCAQRGSGAGRGSLGAAPSGRQGAREAAPSRLGGGSAVGAAAAAPRPANNARADWPRALCCVPTANRGGRGAVGVVQWRGRPGDSGRDRGGASERPQPPALPEGPQRYGPDRPRRRPSAGQPGLRPP